MNAVQSDGLAGLTPQLWADPESTTITGIMRLARQHGVRHVYLQYTTLPGRVLAKVVPIEHFERLAETGLRMAYVVAGGLAVDRHGALIGPNNQTMCEGVIKPDLSTFRILPWDSEFARVTCNQFRAPHEEVDPNAPVQTDPRGLLMRVHEDFRAAHGLTLRTGTEPEMSWFDSPDRIDTSTRIGSSTYGTSYRVEQMERVRPILKKVTAYGRAMGLDMIQADYEDPGQLEMNFQFADALHTADNLMTFRQICKQVAQELGVVATFMPKPIEGIMGNGCHHHLSLWTDDGKPAFEDQRTGEFGELGRYAVGGLLTHARPLMAIMASTVNSYARYWDVGQVAPTVPNWGFDDRRCSMRIIRNARVEYRYPDASCNPYLTHAAMLLAMRDGIENKVDPGAPLSAEELSTTEVGGEAGRFPGLPRTLGEAVDAFEDSALVKEHLPAELRETFIWLKRDEWERACGAVTEWQRDLYMDYTP